jgi:hypothetical protein
MILKMYMCEKFHYEIIYLYNKVLIYDIKKVCLYILR